MRRSVALLFLLFGAFHAAGQVITSLDPSGFKVNSGEHFLTAHGKYLGDTFVYSGPAGTFVVEAGAVDTWSSVAWVPSEIIMTPGTYTLEIRGPNGTTEPVGFKVTSTSRILPLYLVVPEVLTAAARTTKGAYVKFDVSAAGGSIDDAVIRCEPESGSFFYVGTSRVGCTATNSAGETASETFSLSVIDGPPILTLPASNVVPPDTDRGTYVKYEASAYDEVDDAAVPVVCKPESGSLFPWGVTVVECSASDSMGNTELASFTVEVTKDER